MYKICSVYLSNDITLTLTRIASPVSDLVNHSQTKNVGCKANESVLYGHKYEKEKWCFIAKLTRCFIRGFFDLDSDSLAKFYKICDEIPKEYKEDKHFRCFWNSKDGFSREYGYKEKIHYYLTYVGDDKGPLSWAINMWVFLQENADNNFFNDGNTQEFKKILDAFLVLTDYQKRDALILLGSNGVNCLQSAYFVAISSHNSDVDIINHLSITLVLERLKRSLQGFAREGFLDVLNRPFIQK